MPFAPSGSVPLACAASGIKQLTRAADALGMERSSSTMLRRTGALAIAALAAGDVLYRLLLRESVRRALGMSD
jgi:hypothetical protein